MAEEEEEEQEQEQEEQEDENRRIRPPERARGQKWKMGQIFEAFPDYLNFIFLPKFRRVIGTLHSLFRRPS